MKKTSKKLQLKKNIVAELAKKDMNQVGGAGSIITCPCITEYPTHPCNTQLKQGCLTGDVCA